MSILKKIKASILGASALASVLVSNICVASLDTEELAAQHANIVFSYIGQKLGYTDTEEEATKAGFQALERVAGSDRVSDLRMALLIANNPRKKVTDEEYIDDVDKNDFVSRVQINNLFQTKLFMNFTSDCMADHIINFIAPALYEGSSFFSRSDSYGFDALFAQNKSNSMQPIYSIEGNEEVYNMVLHSKLIGTARITDCGDHVKILPELAEGAEQLLPAPGDLNDFLGTLSYDEIDSFFDFIRDDFKINLREIFQKVQEKKTKRFYNFRRRGFKGEFKTKDGLDGHDYKIQTDDEEQVHFISSQLEEFVDSFPRNMKNYFLNNNSVKSFLNKFRIQDKNFLHFIFLDYLGVMKINNEKVESHEDTCRYGIYLTNEFILSNEFSQSFSLSHLNRDGEVGTDCLAYHGKVFSGRFQDFNFASTLVFQNNVPMNLYIGRHMGIDNYNHAKKKLQAYFNPGYSIVIPKIIHI